MVRVTLRIPESDAVVPIVLKPGGAALVGRSPDITRLPHGQLERAGRDIQTIPVASRLVSENHLLLWCEAENVYCLDLRSRNGTRVELPAAVPVAMPSRGALVFDLVPPGQKIEEARPRDALWSRDDEFPVAVAKEVSAWLQRSGFAASARPRRRAERDTTTFVAKIPVGQEWEIAIVEEAGTQNAKWPVALQVIWEYVHSQRARLRDAEEQKHDGAFIMASPGLQDAHRKIVEAAERGLRVILLGETGVGKSALARCYALHSKRRGAPFEWVNCAHIDKNFAHTKLFGAKKGAYTSCDADIKGAVECADHGVLFLDEIGMLPEDVQGELLTFLDDQHYKRLGDSQHKKSDVWVVCGANTDLRRAVRDGAFREDLWYRLAGRVIEVPPLRDRREDVRAFLETRVLGELKDALVAYEALSADARALVVHEYDWPGNFRELESFVRRLPVTSIAQSLSVEICREALREGMIARSSVAVSAWSSLIEMTLEAYKRIKGGDEPRTAEDLAAYVEEVLKPSFFAHRLGLEDIDAVPVNPKQSYNKMGQILACSGETVKAQIENYVRMKREAQKKAQRP